MPVSKDCPAVLAAISYVFGTQSQGPGKFSTTLCSPVWRGTLTLQQERLGLNYCSSFPKWPTPKTCELRQGKYQGLNLQHTVVNYFVAAA